MMNEYLLEIKNLKVYFDVYEGVLKVLENVHFNIKSKEKVGLIGEAGCGKTTMAKSILRILANNSIIPNTTIKQEILFEGKNILQMNHIEIQRLRREKISIIFQDPTAALNPVFKIGTLLKDLIKVSLKSNKGVALTKKEIHNYAIDLLKEVALPDPERILENYPIMLSGGMRQRICIAMSIVTSNKLLIADEPGTSLDVTIQDQVLRLLNNLVKERDTSIILISHNLGAVRGLVDRVYTMYAGSMVEIAKTSDLFSEPLHPYTKGLLKAIPKITGEGMPEGIPGRIPDYINPPKGCRFHPRCKYVKPICKDKIPPLFDAGSEHKVACNLYGDG